MSIIRSVAKQLLHLSFFPLHGITQGGIICYLTLILLSSVYAQGQAGTDIAVLKAGVGARALGMGGAFTAVADNSDAPYWNPAGLGWISSDEITTMQTKLSTDADHYYVSYVKPLWGGALGVSWIQIGLGNITQTSKEVDSHNEVQNLNIFSYFSSAYLLSYGKMINEKLSIGLTGKYLMADMNQIAGGAAAGYSLTPALLYKFGAGNSKSFTVGLKLEDILNQQQWANGTIEKALPKLRLGLAYQASNPGLFSLDISQTLKTSYAPEITGGYEWNGGKGLSFRTGYVDGGITAGAGFLLDHARVDYAFILQKAFSKENVHRISLSGIW